MSWFHQKTGGFPEGFGRFLGKAKLHAAVIFSPSISAAVCASLLAFGHVAEVQSYSNSPVSSATLSIPPDVTHLFVVGVGCSWVPLLFDCTRNVM